MGETAWRPMELLGWRWKTLDRITVTAAPV
jgi:hypothetical protein